VRSRLDDLEAELGRPPNPAEQERLIKSYGHPALLAGRYGPRRQLVGPEMFPFYWFVLRVAMSTAVLVHVILPMAPQWHVPERWDPASLPPVDPKPPRRPRSIPQLVVITFFIVWYSLPPIIFGPQSVFTLAPVWRTLYVPIVLLALVDLVLRWVAFFRPNTTRLRAFTRILVRAASLVILFVLLRAGDLVVGGEAGRSLASQQFVLTIINTSVYSALILAGAVSIVGLVLDVRWLVRRGGDGPQGFAITCWARTPP
jgi:hypothetical protein